MALIHEDLVAFLLAQAPITAITSNISVDSIPSSKDAPYIWLNAYDNEDEVDLSGRGLSQDTFFDCEAVSASLSEAKTLGAAVKTALHGTQGTFGAREIYGAFIRSKDDSYEPTNRFEDATLNVVATDIHLMHQAD